MSPLRTLLLLAICVLVGPLACSYTDPGTGSGTLQVAAQLAYTAGATDTSHLSVEILDLRGQPVSEASVLFSDGDTEEEFTATEADITNAPGVYTLEVPRYRRRLELKIVKGKNHLRGSLEGPGRHTILTPAHASTLRRRDLGDNLVVTWGTTDGIRADQITLRLKDEGFSTTELADWGETTVPSKELQSGAETVSVIRRNTLTFAEGLHNSMFEIAYEVTHAFQVQD